PVLLINGTDDNSIPAENSNALRNTFDHATVKIIDGRHIGTGRNEITHETLFTLEEWVEQVLVKSDKNGD
ncbi:MAG: alpha/beta fold hydrolase, partial [Candidatus Muiribacteriaceae bacterium]